MVDIKNIEDAIKLYTTSILIYDPKTVKYELKKISEVFPGMSISDILANVENYNLFITKHSIKTLGEYYFLTQAPIDMPIKQQVEIIGSPFDTSFDYTQGDEHITSFTLSDELIMDGGKVTLDVYTRGNCGLLSLYNILKQGGLINISSSQFMKEIESSGIGKDLFKVNQAMVKDALIKSFTSIEDWNGLSNKYGGISNFTKIILNLDLCLDRQIITEKEYTALKLISYTFNANLNQKLNSIGTPLGSVDVFHLNVYQDIYNHFVEDDSKKNLVFDSFLTPIEILEKYEEGHGVMIPVSTDVFQSDNSSGKINHMVSISGVAKNPDTGEFEGVYIIDTGNQGWDIPQRSRYIPIELFETLISAWNKPISPIIYTKAKILEQNNSIKWITPDGTYWDDYSEFFDDIKISFSEFSSSSLSNVDKVMMSVKILYAVAQVQSDPLILDLDNDGIETIALEDSTAHYDLDRNGMAEHTGWVSGDDGLLIIDKNDNGMVDGIDELFGNDITVGFEQLKEYDTNSDLTIDSNDDDFQKIKVWQDSNEDGICDTGEVKTLAELQIQSIDLNYQSVNEDNNGNRISETSTFTYTNNETSTIADVNFAVDLVDSKIVNDIELDPSVFSLPSLRGFGSVPDLYYAMSENTDLRSFVEDLSQNIDLKSVYFQMDELLSKWAGVETIAYTENRGAYSARKLAVLEKFMGQDYRFGNTSPDSPDKHNAERLDGAYKIIKNLMFSHIVAQTFLSDTLGDASIDLETDTIIYTKDTTDIIDSFKTAFNTADEDISALLSIVLNVLNTEGSLDVSGLQGHIDSRWYDCIIGNTTLTYDKVIPNGVSDKDVFGIDGNNLIYGSMINDNLYTYDGGENLIYTYNGDDTIIARNGAHTIYAGSGDDYIQSYFANDIIYGGTGNDTIENSIGVHDKSSTFSFNSGDGQDTIINAKNDSIVFDGDITASNLTFDFNQNDITIKLVDNNSQLTGDQIYLQNALWNANSINNIIFTHDNTTMSYGSMVAFRTSVTSNDSVIYGTCLDDSILAGSGNNTIYTYNGDDTISSGAGNDTMYGGAGNDTYIYSSGEDTIYDINGSIYTESGEDDKIIFDNITSSSIVVSLSDNDLAINVNSGGKVNIIYGLNDYTKIEEYQFEDVTLTYSELLELRGTITGTSGNDTTLIGSSTSDIIEALAGDDIINSYGGNDTITGGAGNDIIHDSSGNDIYNFSITDGQDIISDSDGQDTINFTGISSTSLIFAASNSDLIVNLDSNDKVTISDGLTESKRIESFVCDDTTLSYVQALSLIGTITGTSGNDTLNGSILNDKFSGGAGDDIFNGGIGDDIYYYSAGDGQDLITDTAGSDTIVFNDITKDKIIFSADQNDVVLTFLDESDDLTGDSLRITNQLSEENKIESFEFADSSIISSAEVLDLTNNKIVCTRGITFISCCCLGIFINNRLKKCHIRLISWCTL